MLFRLHWSAAQHHEAFEEMKRLEKFGRSEEYARMMQEWNEAKPGNDASEQN